MIENPMEWFESKATELENDKKKKDTLVDLKAVVMNSEKQILNDIVHNVSLNPIFECLNTSDSQEIESICVIVFELLNEMTVNELLKVYDDAIHTCLLHPSNQVKEMALKLLEKTVNMETIEYMLEKHAVLLIDAADCLTSSERSAAEGAILMFIKMGSSTPGLNVLYSNLILKKLQEVSVVNETSRFRVYEIVVAVAQISEETLAASVSSGFMGNLVSEVSSSDILIQLNALELLSNLASSSHGLSYLQQCKVIDSLVDKLLKLKEEPLSLVLLPGLIEFFGNLYALQPQHFTKEYPQVMELLFNSLETTDEILLGVIITTVGKIGSTSNGRLVLDKYPRLMESLFGKIGQILTTKNDLALSVMNSLSEMLKHIDGNPNLDEITKKWFNSISPDALDCALNLAKLPFIEFRLAAFSLLKVIATQQWGAEKLINFPGMIEFLLDRSTEFMKDCKQTKFEVVCNMVQCPNLEQIVTPEVLHDLKEFIKEGPFFVSTQVEMAIGGEM